MSLMSIKSPSRKVLCVCQTRGSNNYYQTFDPTTDEWNPPLPGPQTPFPANAAIAESQGCIYVMGGVSKNGDKINTCSKLSLKSLEWNTSPAMKVKKSHAAAIGCNEFIYVVGGESKYGTALGNAERFDPIGEVWRMLPSMRKPRRSPTVQVIKNGRVYVMGGYNGAEWILSCEMFDPSNRSWTELSPLPNHEFSSGELCSCIYDVTTLSVISCRRPRSIAFYDWEIGTWRREIERVGMTPSSPKAIIPFGDQIYVIDYTRHVFIYYLHTHVWEKVAGVPSGDAKLLFAVLVDNWIEKPKEEQKPNVGANAHEQHRSPAGDAAKAHPAHVT